MKSLEAQCERLAVCLFEKKTKVIRFRAKSPRFPNALLYQLTPSLGICAYLGAGRECWRCEVRQICQLQLLARIPCMPCPHPRDIGQRHFSYCVCAYLESFPHIRSSTPSETRGGVVDPEAYPDLFQMCALPTLSTTCPALCLTELHSAHR